MAQFITGKQIMEQGFVDLREFIDYENPGSFLSRGDGDKLKALLGTELFELEGSFIKKIGFIIPEELKKSGEFNGKGGAVNTVELKKEVKTEEAVKAEAHISDGEAIEVNAKIEQLEKEVVEWKENWNKIHKQMEIDDMEYLTLEKKYKELQKGLSDVDNQESSVQRYEDKKWMTIGELKIGYIELVNMIKSVESENKTIKEKFDSELKKQVGEIMKKNEYLQEDIAKMEREVFDYKQEPIKARKYFYKFKVAYDMMIEAGAKDPDRKAVEKEVNKFDDEKIKQQIDSGL